MDAWCVAIALNVARVRAGTLAANVRRCRGTPHSCSTRAGWSTGPRPQMRRSSDNLRMGCSMSSAWRSCAVYTVPWSVAWQGLISHRLGLPCQLGAEEFAVPDCGPSIGCAITLIGAARRKPWRCPGLHADRHHRIFMAGEADQWG